MGDLGSACLYQVKEATKNAIKGYREINMKGMKLVKMAVIWQLVPAPTL